MTVWWSRRGVYEPPDVLTSLDIDWLSPHLRLAGLSDEDPPPSTAAAAMVGAHRLGQAMRGDRISYANAERQTAMDGFIAQHYNPALVDDGDGAVWRRRRR